MITSRGRPVRFVPREMGEGRLYADPAWVASPDPVEQVAEAEWRGHLDAV